MTPTNKGNYMYCRDCVHKIKDSYLKYPCRLSHRKVRGNVKYKKEFKMCKELKEIK